MLYMLTFVFCILFLFFFFKQKTAYEMRISDWSSDVCSSDLAVAVGDHTTILQAFNRFERLDQARRAFGIALERDRIDAATQRHAVARPFVRRQCIDRNPGFTARHHHGGGAGLRHREDRARMHVSRSEEHTSELQSLMRISYAVFCLKK